MPPWQPPRRTDAPSPEAADGPFTRLRVLTPRLSLEPIDDAMARRLADLASRGVHKPDTMPFAFPWTDAPAHELEANTVEFHRGNRADLQPHRWAVNFAVVADGALVGSTGLGAEAFPASRRFETGSWLGLEFQGRGLGKEMRLATLHLGFLGLDALVATTHAFHDNAASLGVTESLGYRQVGEEQRQRRGRLDTSLAFEITADDFRARLRRDDIRLEGVQECLPLLGLA